MKKLAIAAILLMGSLAASTSGQSKSGVQAHHSGSLEVDARAVLTPTRARVSNSTPEPSSRSTPAWGNATLDTSAETFLAATTNTPIPVVVPSSLTHVYRVGVGDVLDVQLVSNRNNKSTLFTVLEGGMLDFPLAKNPVPVAGLTAEEIAARLREQIRVFEAPAVEVKVRDHASHTVKVSGLVASAGVKTLQREAVPLYVVMSQARPLPEAARAIIVRAGRPAIEVNLREVGSFSTLLVPGDIIKFSGYPAGSSMFFFAGGAINAPGQKPYHEGLTLTQAILASGGAKRAERAKVLLSRQGFDGRLVTIEYNLRQIGIGKIPDPVLQEGDRLQVRNK